MQKKKKKDAQDHALHEATHGQFGEEPTPELMPSNTFDVRNAEDRIRAARRKSRTV